MVLIFIHFKRLCDVNLDVYYVKFYRYDLNESNFHI